MAYKCVTRSKRKSTKRWETFSDYSRTVCLERKTYHHPSLTKIRLDSRENAIQTEKKRQKQWYQIVDVLHAVKHIPKLQDLVLRTNHITRIFFPHRFVNTWRSFAQKTYSTKEKPVWNSATKKGYILIMCKAVKKDNVRWLRFDDLVGCTVAQ